MKKKRKRVILVNIIVFVLGFVFIDFILGQFKIPYDFSYCRIKHPYFHHGLKPNCEHLTTWGGITYPIAVNSLGFRDSAVREVPLKSNKHRILIMGDSHAEGVGVVFKNTFAGILQQKTANSDIEILNASAVSYSPLIHYLKSDYFINQKGLEVNEIWVFVDISDMQNEIAYEAFHPVQTGAFYQSKQHILNFFNRNSFSYYTVKTRNDANRINAFVAKMEEFDPRQAANLHKNTVELYEDFFRDFDNDDLLRSPEFHGVGEWYYDSATIKLAEKGLKLCQKNIAKLSKLCSDKNIRLRLSIHPWQSQIEKQDTLDYYVNNWKQFCNKHKIEFINLFPLFIDEENPIIVQHKYYIVHDNHWNEEGHKKVGNFLYNSFLR